MRSSILVQLAKNESNRSEETRQLIRQHQKYEGKTSHVVIVSEIEFEEYDVRN